MIDDLSIHGAFDVATVEAYLASLPTAARDPRGANGFWLATRKSALDAELAADHAVVSDRVAVVYVAPELIQVACTLGGVEPCRTFVQWLRRRYAVAFSSGGTPIAADARLDAIFDEPAAAFVAPVGFFRELRHGDRLGPSLADARRDAAALDAAQLVAYLRAAPELFVSPGPVYDVFARGDAIGTAGVHTDGVYAWPDDLAYYVERYHVALPEPFTTHARLERYAVPAVELGVVQLARD